MNNLLRILSVGLVSFGLSLSAIADECMDFSGEFRGSSDGNILEVTQDQCREVSFFYRFGAEGEMGFERRMITDGIPRPTVEVPGVRVLESFRWAEDRQTLLVEAEVHMTGAPLERSRGVIRFSSEGHLEEETTILNAEGQPVRLDLEVFLKQSLSKERNHSD